MAQEARPFLLGVNYWPRRSATAWWKTFDAAEVAQEFDVVGALGLAAIRLFLLWEDFQPAEARASFAAVRNLERVLDLAADRGLRAMPTFFTGHMSGVNFVPAWLLGGVRRADPRFRLVSDGRVVQGRLRDYYTEPALLDAQRLLLRTVLGDLRDHPAVYAWDLGNEHDNVLRPRSADAAGAWIETLLGAAREADPAHPVTFGFHGEDVESDKGVRLTDLGPRLDLVTMHGYAAYAAWGRGPLDATVPPFVLTLASALAGRPVLMSEFGLPTTLPGEPAHEVEARRLGGAAAVYLADEEQAAAHVRDLVDGLHAQGALGAFYWCFADYDPAAWAAPPLDWAMHERTFGLVRSDLAPKRHAQVLREIALERRTVAQPATILDVDREEYYRAPLAELRRQFTIYLGG